MEILFNLMVWKYIFSNQHTKTVPIHFNPGAFLLSLQGSVGRIQGPGMGLVQRQMKKLPSHIHCMDGKDRFGDVFGWTTTNVGVTSVLFRIHFQIWRYRIDGSISTIWSDGILFYVLFTKFTTQIWLLNSMPSNPISHILICDKLYQFV